MKYQIPPPRLESLNGLQRVETGSGNGLRADLFRAKMHKGTFAFEWKPGFTL